MSDKTVAGRVGASTHARGFGGSSDSGEWNGEASRPVRDIKKVVLIAGLGILSWVATYVGMLELIESNMGDLPIVHKAIVGFSVAMLMTMIIWLLDQMFAPVGFFTKLCYVAGYVFLTLISVGFGFGFYWKVLESRSGSLPFGGIRCCPGADFAAMPPRPGSISCRRRSFSWRRSRGKGRT